MLDSIEYEDENGNTQTLVSYTYDENGIRVSKQFDDRTTYYTTTGGTITSQYTIDSRSNVTEVIEFLYNSNNEVVGFTYNGDTYFYLKNTQGDVTNIVDDSGENLVDYYYNAWGVCTTVDHTETADNQTSIATINPLRYRGYYFENDLDMYYLQSRYYMPYLYRFLNADDPQYAKVGKDDTAGINLFAYCNNDPVNNSDPTGYWGKDVHSGYNKNGSMHYKTLKYSNSYLCYGTYYWACKCNYSVNFAYNIGYWCNDVDKTYNPSNLKNNDWHFNSYWGKKGKTDSRIIHKNQMLNNAKKYLNIANNKRNKKIYYKDDLRKALKYIGYALHPTQDRYAHILNSKSKYSSYSIGYGHYSHVGVSNVDNAKVRCSDVINTGAETMNILKSLYKNYSILKLKNVNV